MDSLDKQRNYELAEKLLSEQNFGAAVIARVVAMILLVGIYGIVKSLSDGLYYSILAWMFTDLHFADLMFWIIGIGGAAYFARRPLTREEGFALHTYKMNKGALYLGNS
jgi:hypothetical protein